MTTPTSAKGRLVQTFKFLKALNELRNPVPRDLSGVEVLRLDDWPAHPCVQVHRFIVPETPEYEGNMTGDGDSQTDPLIRIERAELTLCPKPPAVLDGWVKPGWEAVDVEVTVLKARNFTDKVTKMAATVAFTDEQDRVQALDTWKVARDKWAEAERPAVEARRLYDQIHALWTRMQREDARVELVLADGMLCVTGHGIQHPVLLQRVSLHFDSAIPEFRFTAGTDKVELYGALLRLVPDMAGQWIAGFDKELDEQPIEPLGGESTNGFFRRLVQGLFTDGEFLKDKPLIPRANSALIWREPVIFLRSRSAGLSATLDSIVEDLGNDTTQVPEGLARIVGVDTIATPPGDADGAPQIPPGLEPDILFSKPANAEQYQIAKRLARTKAVLVQGPPGTGKTYTIANLLGHLLAQGKTVLVTAHTTKALRVLRQQVDAALQPLCLSVLDDDAESQAQLARAAQEIADRLTRSVAEDLRQEAGQLRVNRQRLLDKRGSLQQQIRAARYSEIEEIVFAGEGLSPIEVAKRVNADHADAARDGWIPGPLPRGDMCPLSSAEVQQLYASQGRIIAEDEGQLEVPQPALAELMVPGDFHRLVKEIEHGAMLEDLHRPEFWDGTAAAGYILYLGIICDPSKVWKRRESSESRATLCVV